MLLLGFIFNGFFFKKTSINAIKCSTGKSNFLFTFLGAGEGLFVFVNSSHLCCTVYGFLGIFQINSVSYI